MDINLKKSAIDSAIKDIFSDVESLKAYSNELVAEIKLLYVQSSKEKICHSDSMAKYAKELSSSDVLLAGRKSELEKISSKFNKISEDIELLDLEIDRKQVQNKSIEEKEMDFNKRERSIKKLEERILKDEALFKIKVAGADKSIKDFDKREAAIAKKDKEQEERAIYLQGQRDNLKSKLPEWWEDQRDKVKVVFE